MSIRSTVAPAILLAAAAFAPLWCWPFGVAKPGRSPFAQELSRVSDRACRESARVDGGPMLIGDTFQVGQYELLFHAGDYLKAKGFALTEPPFLDVIPIRFGISDTTAHYHVPLLLSPYGYSTYRGS